jgi:hypothetical protein
LVRGILAKDGYISRITENPIAFVTCGFLENSQVDEPGNKTVGGSESCARKFLYLRYGNNGTLIQGLQYSMAISGGTAKMGRYNRPMIFPQSENGARGFGGFPAHADNALQEKDKPLLPMAMIPNGLETLVVFGAMLFEVMG